MMWLFSERVGWPEKTTKLNQEAQNGIKIIIYSKSMCNSKGNNSPSKPN